MHPGTPPAVHGEESDVGEGEGQEEEPFFVTENVMDNMVHQYFIGMKAHFCYWHHMILCEITPEPTPATQSSLLVD
ncbi:hypothetical protein BC829DRAFT_381371 [Chytridium lagenaria]|nr:hypothetical protein BC829DRAFT_381371 [Chytridium lagenaria]